MRPSAATMQAHDIWRGRGGSESARQRQRQGLRHSRERERVRYGCARAACGLRSHFWLGRAGTKEVQDATREKELAEIRMSAQTALEQEAAKRELVRVSAAPTKCETFGSTRINCHPTTTLRSQEKKEADVKMIKERSERLLARHTLS